MINPNIKRKKSASGVIKPPLKPDQNKIYPMPDPKLLTRALPIATSEIHNVGIAELGRLAEAILGYDYLEKQMPKPSETLTQTLIRLRIEVLDTKQVEEYMEKRKKAVSGVGDVDEALFDDDEEEIDNSEVQWFNNDIRRYRHPIPERVLALAIHIKKENPDVNFTVYSLNRKDPDPFLSAQIGTEKYYLEVWDEPKFTGVLTKIDAERAGLNNKPKE